MLIIADRSCTSSFLIGNLKNCILKLENFIKMGWRWLSLLIRKTCKMILEVCSKCVWDEFISLFPLNFKATVKLLRLNIQEIYFFHRNVNSWSLILTKSLFWHNQKQLSRGAPWKMCSENMQQIYRKAK